MDLLNRYGPAPERFDELFAADGSVRPHWRALIEHLQWMGPRAMQEAREGMQRQIAENGVTYNVYADARGAERPWDLDLLPHILPAEEWAEIERGIRQRANLLNAVLQDVYGPQRLIGEQLLPANVIQGHPGFLRACHGMSVPGDTYLHLYAADLARSPDGRWWVVNDRTQAPSGAGYALENRALIGGQFSELLKSLRVQPVAGFFQSLHDALAAWAPREDEDPHIVVLTPGPFNETYFEHAYLARQMGVPLVEGQDLTVRQGGVFLKTLSGLRRVHAILRRVDDVWCDPLELRPDSTLGVPGLLDVARRGGVLIANALGSGLIESGALLGYLPLIAERLLGESLLMPSVATWWCGEAAAREEVIERLPELVIKSAWGQGTAGPQFGRDLDAKAREALRQSIQANPRHFVGQELVQPSRAPVWAAISAGLEPRVTGLRVFAAATPNGYVIMPGGLTRVASMQDARIIAMQRGGGSKDTWIIGGAQQSLPLGMRQLAPRNLIREEDHGALASRTGESMFWLSRYVERSDCALRLLRCGLRQQLSADDADWEALRRTGERAGIIARDEEAALTAQACLLKALRDSTQSGSVLFNLRQVLRLARGLRDRLAPDSTRIFNRLDRQMQSWQRGPHTLSDALEFIDQALLSLITLAGYGMEHMARDAGWRFQSLGRRIERMCFLALALENLLVPEAPQVPALASLIDLSDSVLTYRRRYQQAPEAAPVAEHLLVDRDNPRTFLYQIESLIDHVAKLPNPPTEEVVSPLRAIAVRLQARRPERWVSSPESSEALRDLLGDAWSVSNQLANALQHRYFSHVSMHTTFS